MEFGLSEDQKLLQESINGTLARHCPLDRVRAAAEKREPYAEDVWSALVEMGLAGMLVPEAYGGLGLSVLDAALAAEALGRHVAPVPFLSAAVMAPIAIDRAGTQAQKERWLPKIAAGEIIATVAVAEAVSGARDGGGVKASGGKLSGRSLFVPDGEIADLIVVADAEGGLHLVEGAAAGLTKTGLTSIDLTRPMAELAFEDTPGEALAGNAAAPREVLHHMRDVGRIMLAADTLGAGEMMIEKAVEYAKERKQFNRVIGSFQAVKHMCAEMAAELEPCRSLIWYAAHTHDALPDEAPLMSAHAKAHLAEVGRFVARTATEVHGGMGFTDLLGLHYWFKRIGLDRQLLGSPERVREEAARMQGLAA